MARNGHIYLLPVAEGGGQEILKCLPYVHPCVRSSRFCINVNVIYKDIFTNLQLMFTAVKTCLCKIWPNFEKTKWPP